MDLYTIRTQQLNPALAAKLAPFVNAHRPHDTPYSWRELRDDGLERIDEDSLLDIIEDQYHFEVESGLWTGTEGR